jgi:Zn-dependent protease
MLPFFFHHPPLTALGFPDSLLLFRVSEETCALFEFDSQTLSRVLLVVPSILIAASFHEFAHGWAADRFGDSTARMQGRLTLNPIAHIDPLGTILIPFLLALSGSGMFGWAKPVPVNFLNLRNPKADMVWVAAAGPITNLLLALTAGFWLKVLTLLPQGETVFYIFSPIAQFLQFFIYINIILGVFNLIPIPPLDGGRIAVGLLPHEYAQKWASIEPYGMFIIIILVFWSGLGVWSRVISPIVRFIMQGIFFIYGLN